MEDSDVSDEELLFDCNGNVIASSPAFREVAPVDSSSDEDVLFNQSGMVTPYGQLYDRKVLSSDGKYKNQVVLGEDDSRGPDDLGSDEEMITVSQLKNEQQQQPRREKISISEIEQFNKNKEKSPVSSHTRSRRLINSLNKKKNKSPVINNNNINNNINNNNSNNNHILSEWQPEFGPHTQQQQKKYDKLRKQYYEIHGHYPGEDSG